MDPTVLEKNLQVSLLQFVVLGFAASIDLVTFLVNVMRARDPVKLTESDRTKTQ